MSEVASSNPNLSNKPLITAVVCTYNPREDYFSKTLTALGKQSLARDKWRLIVADNNSSPAVNVSCLNLSGEPSSLLKEPKPGKVNAMAGIAPEVEGEWVVFVDDDNVLDAGYFEKLLELSSKYPNLGVLSANISGKFESDVPAWVEPYLWLLAVRPLEADVWANIVAPHIGPIGAGMCVRKVVYDEFVRRYHDGSVNAAHGRSDDSLAAGTDDTVFMDIAFSMGLGCGAFADLKMTHLISKERLELEYLVRLAKDMTVSHTVLALARKSQSTGGLKSLLRPIYRKLFLLGKSRETKAIESAFIKGRAEGERQAAEH